MSKTHDNVMVEWNQINWRKLEKAVLKLQKRIYRASQRGDLRVVRKLQRTLMKSWSARTTSVRKVTQDNTGKNTAGVDGVKSLTPVARVKLASNLKLSGKSRATRRVWIPKPGSDEKRPLGIPTMNDRALQALVKQALEPEWEAKFEPNSYGFRPGRSCQDAIGAIFDAINRMPKYVLDADIAKCFDKIDHEQLLKKLNTFPTLRRQIKAWLKSGVMDGKELFTTSVSAAGARLRATGTPQGGVISPLLANIAIHGMEERVKQFAETLKGGKRDNRNSLSLIRYADDFVILHKDITVVQRCRDIISEWLKDMGLELKPSKTRLTHTLKEYENEKPGFDFLGFNVRQYATGKYHSKQGFKTIITPSKKKQKVHYDQISKIVENHKAAPQEALISRLNPIIRGWSNYYSTVVSKEIFSEQDNLMYSKLRAWAKRRHPNKLNSQEITSKYWQTDGDRNWVFATKENGNIASRLLIHADTLIVRHVKVKGESSPYDGNLVYWSTRRGNNPEMPKRVSILLKAQKGRCTHCDLFFLENDVMEVDHVVPKSQGEKDEYKNLQLLHRHCHDVKTTKDGSLKLNEPEMEFKW